MNATREIRKQRRNAQGDLIGGSLTLLGLIGVGIFICDGVGNWLQVLWFTIAHFALLPWFSLAFWGMVAGSVWQMARGVRRLRNLNERKNDHA